MSFKELEQKHNLVNRVILACGKHPTDADINPLLEERLERFYEDAVIEGMEKQMHSSVDRAVNAMSKELAKPEQEPVAYADALDLAKDCNWDTFICQHSSENHEGTRFKIPLYTAPPRKEWVGLTREDISDCVEMLAVNGLSFARAIEAKLKEKNNAV